MSWLKSLGRSKTKDLDSLDSTSTSSLNSGTSSSAAGAGGGSSLNDVEYIFWIKLQQGSSFGTKLVELWTCYLDERIPSNIMEFILFFNQKFPAIDSSYLSDPSISMAATNLTGKAGRVSLSVKDLPCKPAELLESLCEGIDKILQESATGYVVGERSFDKQSFEFALQIIQHLEILTKYSFFLFSFYPFNS
jgi:hypothetical protein